MTSRAFILLGLLIILLISIVPAHAETMPATENASDPSSIWSYSSPYVSSGTGFVSASASCGDLNSRIPVGASPKVYGWKTYNGPRGTNIAITTGARSGYCSSTCSDASLCGSSTGLEGSYGSTGEALTCPSGTTLSGRSCVTYSCPANEGWTLDGSTCTRGECPYGRNADGSCKGPCAERAGQPATSEGYFTDGIPSEACHDGCTSQLKIECNGTNCSTPTVQVIMRVVGGVETYYTKGQYVYGDNPQACTGSGPQVIPLPPNSCGSNQYSGYINGQYMCIDKTTQQPVPTSPPKTQTTTTTSVTNNDNSVTTTTTTNHTDGTKTVVITTTQPNGTQTTSTTTEGGDSETPEDGSATEATQKEILEELKKTECEKNPDGFGCDSSALDIVNVDLPEETINVAITPVSVGGAGACPADRTYTLHSGQTITWSWALPCQFATGIRPVVLAVAWLSAALLLIGAFRPET